MSRKTFTAKLAALLLVACTLAVGHIAPAAAQACAPGTCCATNPTTGEPACGAAAGNPLNVMSGNKFQREEDMPALPGVLGLELVRYYNSEASLSNHRGLLGRGWRLSYEAELKVQPGGNSIVVHQGDGTQSRYFQSLVQPDASATLYTSALPGPSILIARKVAGAAEYTLSFGPQGNRQVFDAQGKLILIVAPTGEFVSLQRDAAGFLLRVTDPQGRFLSLRHLSPQEIRAGNNYRGIQHIDTPVGRFSYAYGSTAPQGSTPKPQELLANLVKVSLPTHYDASKPANPAGGSADRGTTTSSVTKTYHYEEVRYPSLLTGVSVHGKGSDGKEMNERIVTWGYDPRGRANLSVKGSFDPKRAGAEQVTLAFNHKASDGSGTTVLTNSLGQTTRYSYAQINGQPQLLEVRGAGCATCGAVNVRYRYDGRGRQVEQSEIDDKGLPNRATTTEYDGVDRPIRVSAFNWRNGKPGQPRLLVRYQYGDPANRLPVLIARPSVLAGKEHVTRIGYNDKGQALSVTEIGYEPLEQKQITRTTHYSYSEVNGRSVLTQVDGPLANGPAGSPADSDVTRIEWDRAGSFITAIEEPGSRRSSVQYDGAGLITQVENLEGASTRLEYTYLGLPKLISTQAPGKQLPQVQIFQYDAQGRLTEAGEQDSAGAAYRPKFAQGFDIADRLHWRASRLGILEQHSYDTEGRLVRSGRYSNSMAQTLDFDFDEQGRLRAMRDLSGADYRFSYTASGRIASVSDQIGAVWSTSAEPNRQPRAAKPRQLVDDFRRVVATIDADSGRTTRQYDAAGRIVASRDASGNQARYQYDPQGRITVQTITDVRTGKESQTRWHYQRAHLVWLEHPEQSERYTYDARGLRATKSITLKTAAGVRSSTTRYEFDAQGNLQATSLPDGSRIEYRRNGQGQVIALQRQRIQTPWLRWAVPEQIVVKDLQRDLVGIQSYVTGNGIAAQLQRSKSGALARMVYRNKREPRLLKAELSLPGVSTAHAGTAQQMNASNAATHFKAPMPGALGHLPDAKALIDHRYLWDTRGNLLLQMDSRGKESLSQGYAYDRHNRLLASASPDEFNRYAYDAMGRRVLAQQGAKDQASMQGTVKVRYSDEAYRPLAVTSAQRQDETIYDAGGRPRAIGERAYTWDALGRLQQIKSGDKTLATYRYNHRGERIGKATGQGETAYLYEDKRLTAELNGQGRITRQYIYLADAPIAAIDTPQGMLLADEDVWGALLNDLRTIFATAFTTDNTMVWLHPNHLGAPEAASDAEGKIVWQASYAPFGQVRTKSENFALNIRLPGQYEDIESGLYYNRQRYYDPQQGQYLTPDPLGAPDGPNRYAYVRHNPLRYVDPDGLVLFAFDGTGNSDPVEPGDTISNVRKFYQAYDEVKNGSKFYITGIGTTNEDMPYKGNILTGDGFDQRVALGFDFLEKLINGSSETSTVEIDVVGFSRGAAEARVWTNLLVKAMADGAYTTKEGKKRCLDLRFQGLWDTVPHLGVFHELEKNYDFSIPTQMKHAVHAVALNEHRGGAADFDGLSIFGAPQNSSTVGRLEIGFVGSHADIGGGYGTGDLSNVALMWMIKQATDQGMQMKQQLISDEGWNAITNPILHDKSSNKNDIGSFPLPYEDRQFNYGSDQTIKQSNATVAGTNTEWARSFVDYYNAWCSPSTAPAVGIVDMTRYGEWIKAQGVNITYSSTVATESCK